jgi:hypothetical protein
MGYFEIGSPDPKEAHSGAMNPKVAVSRVAGKLVHCRMA